MHTGQIEKSINVSYINFDVGLYDSKLDQIVGLINPGKDNEGYMEFQMVHLDPVTLNVTKIFPKFSNGKYCDWTFAFGEDVEHGIWYQVMLKSKNSNTCNGVNAIEYQGYLVGVNVSDGTVINEPYLCDYYVCPFDMLYWTDH